MRKGCNSTSAHKSSRYHRPKGKIEDVSVVCGLPTSRQPGEKEDIVKIYKTQQEVEADIKDGVLVVNEAVTFECSIAIKAIIKVKGDINAWNINARDINAWDITAWNINAGDITARDINARDILYYAFCCIYKSILCISIKAKREKYHEPICLEGELKFKKN